MYSTLRAGTGEESVLKKIEERTRLLTKLSGKKKTGC